MKKTLISIAIVATIVVGCATPHTIQPGSPAQPAVTNSNGTVTPAVAAVPPVVEYVPNETLTKGVAAARP